MTGRPSAHVLAPDARDDLLDALREGVGTAHVRTDPQSCAGYLTDWTGAWTGTAVAVVRPGSTDEVAAVLRACRSAGVAVLPQGGNTGLVGGSVPAGGEVLLSTGRLTAPPTVDVGAHTLTAGAGVTLAAAEAAARREGLTLGIDIASRDSATLGGVVATNAGGVRVVRHGTTRSRLRGVEAVLADGRVLRRWTGLDKDNVGYDLPGLLCGSEGTLAVLTAVQLRLAVPAARTTVALIGVASTGDAPVVLDAVLRSGLRVEAAEYVTAPGIALVAAHTGILAPLPGVPVALLVEASGGDEDVLAEVVAGLGDVVQDAVVEPGPAHRLWAVRERHTEALAASSRTPVVKLDVTVPRTRHAELHTAVRAVLDQQLPTARLIAFGHVAEGNAHLNLLDVAPADAARVIGPVLELVAALGGSISSEHGVGRAKRPWTRLSRDEVDLAVMRQIKDALDPAGLLAPGVLLDDG